MDVFTPCASLLSCLPPVAGRGRRESELCGHRGGPGGLLPEPEDGAAVRTHQLCTRHQQSGKVSLCMCVCVSPCVYVRDRVSVQLYYFVFFQPSPSFFFFLYLHVQASIKAY